MAWSTFGTAIACQILHFLGMLTYGGEPGMRKLGIQCMEEMAISALENPCDELVRLLFVYVFASFCVLLGKCLVHDNNHHVQLFVYSKSI